MSVSQRNGSLLLATTPDEVSSLEARLGSLQAAGVTDARLLTSQQLAELEPALRLPERSAGLHVPSDGQLVSNVCALPCRELLYNHLSVWNKHSCQECVHSTSAMCE